VRTPPLLLNQIRMPFKLSEYSDPGKAAQQSAAVQAFSLQSPYNYPQIHIFSREDLSS
jgi:hypothetical protein